MEDLLRPMTRAEYAMLTPAQQAGLGNFKDNPEALRKAATYLENFYAST